MIKNIRWLLVGTLLVGCQGGTTVDPTAPPPAGGPVRVAVGPERPVNLVDHAVLAFRPQGSALVGGYRTHQASVGDGIVELTPFTFETGERRAHAPMALETTSITTDGELLAGALSSTRLDDGSVVLDRGSGVDERLYNRGDGLHQEWHFAQAPPEGNLVVEVTVSGYQYRETTDSGLHFASDDGAGFRYSHAVWIGSDGAEWPIAATFDDGRILLSVPESIVSITTFPAVLDPTVTAEVATDAVVTGPTGSNQQHPSIAFNGTNYLVVWDDARDSSDTDIWGTRLSAAGAILDPLGIKIGGGPGIQSNPTVAHNGTTFIVAWEDFKVIDGTEADIVAAAVSNAGVASALGSVANTGANEIRPVLAARSDGNALVVWNAGGSVTARVFSGGAFGATTAIATGALVERAAVAANPAGNYLVAWSAATDLVGQLVTSAGALSGASFPISAALGTQQSPAATFDGTNYDVVWANSNSGINIFGARISTAGAVLDTRTEGAATVGGVLISGAANNQEVPSIVCQASGCLVTWQDRRNINTTGFDVFGQLVNLDFTLSGTEFVVTTINSSQFGPAVGSSGSGFLAAWSDFRDNKAFNIFGSTVSSAGAVGAAAPVGTGNNRESGPTLGRAGTNFGLFWSDSRVFGEDLMYVRFNTSGSKLDTTARVVSNATYAQFSGAASTDLGANVFVAWTDTRNGVNRDIFGARVSLATGTTLDPAGIALSTAAGDQLVPQVASSGSVALVVWQDRRSGTSFDIFGALINSAGAIVASDIAISSAASDQTRPSVAWDPVSLQFIVVWEDARLGTGVHIFGARVSAAGAVLDPIGVVVSNAANSRFTPVVFSSSAGTFAAWQDRRNAPAGGYNIFGTRLTGGAALSVLDPAGIEVSSNTSEQSQPAIGNIGAGFVVVWSDNRLGTGDIFGQQLTSTGALSGVEFEVTATADHETSPTVLGPGGSATTLRVAYESHRLGTSRIATRQIGTQSDVGSVCSGPTACATGFCVDGYCCTSGCGGNHVAPTPTAAGDCHGCAARFTGQANGICAPLPATSMCRNYRSTFCDLREYCNGVDTTCGVDIGRNQGLVCNRSTNLPVPGVGQGVCPPNAAPGPHPCI